MSLAAELAFAHSSIGAAQRVLLLTPGPHGAALLPQLAEKLVATQLTVLESSRERLRALPASANRQQVLARATRLPFLKNSFDAIVALEVLYAVRPPWTVLAELHRVLKPNGTLTLLEPLSQGLFSGLRDKIGGPGKRVFPIDEIKHRLGRGDWVIRESIDSARVSDFAHPVYCIRAEKIDNPVEPVPQYKTAQEMIAARKKTFPKGEELP